jgi:hypothetical protein
MEATKQEATMNPSIASLSRALLRSALVVATIGPAYAAGQQEAAPLADTVPMAVAAPAAETRAPQPRPAITRIVLSAQELPAAAPARPAYPAQARAPERQLERDAITLRAARTAMLQNDASHQQQRLASLR